jgi:hypothetical protein
MTQYTSILEGSWHKLVGDYRSGRFVPRSEADIQSYLYHLCLVRGCELKRLHAQETYETGRKRKSHPDLVLGGWRSKRLYVEIKWEKLRSRAGIGSKKVTRVRSDIKKSEKRKSKRNRYVLVLFYKEKGGGPLKPKDVTQSQKNAIETKLRRIGRAHVKVMTNL